MRQEDVKDEELVKMLTYRYEYHSNEATKFRKMLDMLASNLVESAPETTKPTRQKIRTRNRQASIKKSFEDVIVDFLKEGQPQTAKMLLEKYSQLGFKAIIQKDFSSKLSMRATKGRIKNMRIDEYPTDRRFWWGLSEWFDGERLKDEYIAKIKDYMDGNR